MGRVLLFGTLDRCHVGCSCQCGRSPWRSASTAIEIRTLRKICVFDFGQQNYLQLSSEVGRFSHEHS